MKKRGKQTHRGRKFWEKTVLEFSKSGETQAAFARRKNLKQTTFGRWVRLLRPKKEEAIIHSELIEIVSPPPERFHSTSVPTRLLVGAATVEFSELPPLPYMTSLLREVGSC